MTEQHSRYIGDDGEERDFFKDHQLQKDALLRTLGEVRQGLGLCTVQRFMKHQDTVEELFPDADELAREQAGMYVASILGTTKLYIEDIVKAVQTDEPFTADQAYHELARGSVRRTFTLPDEHVTVTEYKDERPDSQRQNVEFSSTVTYLADNGQKVNIEYGLRRVQASNAGEVEETQSFGVTHAFEFIESETRWPEREQSDEDDEDEVTEQNGVSMEVTLGGMLSGHSGTQTGWRSDRALATLKQVSTDLHEAHLALVDGGKSS